MKNFLPKHFAGLLLLFCLAAMTSCKKGPADRDIEDSVRQYYLGISLQAGGGSYDISGITILNKFKTMHNDTLVVEVAVSGMYENGSIAGEAGEPRSFSDTVSFSIFQNNAKSWEAERIENFESPLK